MDRERQGGGWGEREEESSLQLLAHVPAITDTNDPRVKHAKLSHRFFLEPVCLGVRETETKLGEKESLSQPAIERGMKFRSDRVYERMGRARDRRWLFRRTTVLSPTGASRYQG